MTAALELKARLRQDAEAAIVSRDAQHKAFCQAEMRLARYGAFYDLIGKTSESVAREMRPDLAKAADEVEAAVRELTQDRNRMMQSLSDMHAAVLAEIGNVAAARSFEAQGKREGISAADLVMGALEEAGRLRHQYVDQGRCAFDESGPMTHAICRSVASSLGVPDKAVANPKKLMAWFRQPVYGIMKKPAFAEVSGLNMSGVSFAPHEDNVNRLRFCVYDPTCMHDFRTSADAIGAEILESGTRDPVARRGALQKLTTDLGDLSNDELDGEALYLGFMTGSVASRDRELTNAWQSVRDEIGRRGSTPAP
ncbi:hypothetical protein [Bosea sp. RAC05]|uniref:hypothetical protein n=1 Tax=Bosea sp. RAC05 TaxID=1842539 RepID=UPI00083CE8F6|nr:hypothetical protein [Bosea sp. RAC05]AOG02821.1 hypothetical protein BSY19_4702 [Bosea sp. RAC05]